MKGGLKIIRIAGINVYVHWSFTLLLAYVTFIGIREGHSGIQILWSLISILLVFFIVTLHELGHALAAKQYGFSTKNITLLPIGGVAQLEGMPEKPVQEFVVAIAGPLVNVVLAIALYFISGIPSPDEITKLGNEGVNENNILAYLLIVNIMLVVFNLIPAFPMDGGRVLRALLAMRLERYRATLIAARIGQFIAFIFIIGGFFVNPFLILIGVFVIMGAQAETEMTRTNSVLKGATLRNVLMRNYETLDANEPLRAAVAKLLNGPNKNFVVLENSKPVGTLNRNELIRGLSAGGNDVPVKNYMNADLLWLEDDEPLESVKKHMIDNNYSVALVVSYGEFLGIVDTENIAEYILVKTAQQK